MAEYRQFAKDVGIIGTTNLILALRGLILIPIIAKTIGASGYGIWAQVIVTLKFIAPMASLVLDFTFVRFFAGQKSKEEIQEGFYSIFITIFCWSCLIASIIFFLATPIAKVLFKDGEAMGIVRIMAILIPVSSMNTLFLFYFRTFRQMKTYSALMLTQNFGEIALIFCLIVLGFGVFGAVISLLIVGVLMDLIMLGVIVSQIGIKAPRFFHIKFYLKFGLPLIPSNLSHWMTDSSDRYVIALFMGMGAVGIYSVAYRIGSILLMFATPLNFVLVPALSKSYDEGKTEEVKRLLAYSLKYLLFLVIPSAFGLSILGKSLLRNMAQHEFVSPGSLVIPFVALSMVLFCIYEILWQVINLVKKTKIIGIIWGIAGLTNLTLNIIFVPMIGILGAAIATLVCFTMVTAVAAVYALKWLRFPIDGCFILKSLIASIIMSLVIWYINPIHVLSLVLCIGIGVGIYVAVLILLKGFTKEEIKFFRNLFTLSYKTEDHRDESKPDSSDKKFNRK